MPTSKAKSKKKIKKKSKPVSFARQDFYQNVQGDMGDLKERFDKMNGAVPFIKESIQRVEGVIIKIDSKIDNLHNYNLTQDKEISNNRIDIAKNSKVVSWVEKVFILAGAGAFITALAKLMFEYVF